MSAFKFLSNAFTRAKERILSARREARAKRMLSNSGLVRISERFMALTNVSNLEATERVLDEFHRGHYLVVTVGMSGIPKGAFASMKLEFGSPESIAEVASACQVVNRWHTAHEKNIVVLCCPDDHRDKLVACSLYYSLQICAARGHRSEAKRLAATAGGAKHHRDGGGSRGRVTSRRGRDDQGVNVKGGNGSLLRKDELPRSKDETPSTEERPPKGTPVDAKTKLEMFREASERELERRSSVGGGMASSWRRSRTLTFGSGAKFPKRIGRRVRPSQRRFMRDFRLCVESGMLTRAYPLMVKEILIERLPPVGSSGTRMSVLITHAHGISHSTMQHGGIIWLPSTTRKPATAVIPINALVRDSALLKVYHHPDQASTFRPQKLLFQVRMYLNAARRKGYRLSFTKGDMDRTTRAAAYSNKFRLSVLFEEPAAPTDTSATAGGDAKRTAATRSPFADPDGSLAQAVREEWHEAKNGKGVVQVTRVSYAQEARKKAGTAPASKRSCDDEKASDGVATPGAAAGTTAQSTPRPQQDADTLPASAPSRLVRSHSAPMTNDERLARALQAQFDLEAEEDRRLQAQIEGRSSSGSRRSAGRHTAGRRAAARGRASAGGRQHSDDAKSARGSNSFAGDEAFARQLQRQMDREIREGRIHSLLRQGLDPSSLDYEQLLELDNYVRPRRSRRRAELVSMLPEFECKGGSQLEQKCMVCFEKYKVGESLRSLPCIHTFHRKCIDRWLLRSTKCPICNRRIDEANYLE